MNTKSAINPLFQNPKASNTFKVFTALVSGAGIFILAISTLLIGFQLFYLGRIFPGVTLAGIDLSGMQPSQAAQIISDEVKFDTSGSIIFQDEIRQFEYTPDQLGLEFDPATNARSAYQIGRLGWPWTRLFEQANALSSGVDLAPKLNFNGPAAQKELEAVALEINQPVVEAALSIEGLDVQIRSGQIGRTLDVWSTIAFLSAQFMTLESGLVPLVILTTPPSILDASHQADIARSIISEPLNLLMPNGGASIQIDRVALADMLVIQRTAVDGVETYQIGLDRQQLLVMLAGLAPQKNQPPRNARFIFNDETRKLDLIEPAIVGQILNVDASIEYINQQLSQGNHQIELVYDLNKPDITDDTTAEQLEITELIQSQTTYFYGSSLGRIKNIQIAAAQFHGLFIAPGAVFSMAENIGDITLDSGYAESLIIYGDRTIKGVGGGVCQVSTTLFRAVFFAGFPVVERYQHAYRVYYYELNQSGVQDSRFAGLDATLYTPLVDFKFKNDSEYWILMETYVNVAARSITWKFYSTSDGREVTWNSSGLTNVVNPPEPVYEENDNLKRGEVEQVDWAVKGADVRITRNVTRNGILLFNDEFNTHYKPWAMVCQYGPKTKDYPPKKVDSTATSCE